MGSSTSCFYRSSKNNAIHKHLQWSPKTTTVVTELPKAATTLLPGCERKWWRCIGDPLQHCHNSWLVTCNSFTMLATMARLGDLAILSNSLKKSPSVSVVWQPLAMEGNVLATYWQRTGVH